MDNDSIISELSESGILEGFRHAAEHAFQRTRELLTLEYGHTPTTKGQLNYDHLTRCLDETFGLHSNDGVYGETSHAPLTLGHLVGCLQRNDFMNIRTWQNAEFRFHLLSVPPGRQHNFSWKEKGDYRHNLSLQTNNENMLPLDWSTFSTTHIPVPPFDGITLFLVHSLDPFTGEAILYIGQCQHQVARNSNPWKSLVEIYRSSPSPTPTINAEYDDFPTGGATLTMEDAPVRLKTPPQDEDAI